MAKTVTIGNGVAHLCVSDRHRLTLCGATHKEMWDFAAESRKLGTGDVTCQFCTQVLETAVSQALVTK